MFPLRPLKEVKQAYPSKAHGRSWDAELAFRQECKTIIINCGAELRM